MSKTKYTKRKGAKKTNRKRGMTKRSSNVPDLASLSVKRTIVAPPSGGTFQTNTMYKLMDTQLIDYQRAVQVAQAYQHFRIKKIKITWKPLYDTFVGAVGSTVSKPNLYFMIDKSGSIPTNVTLEGLKAMGAKPKQLDEKNLSFEWSPSVLEATMYAGGGAGVTSASKYKISPWLTTNANVVSPGVFQANGTDHLGIYWYVDQLLNTQAAYAYTCEVEVQFQFKKPLSANNIGTTEALSAQLAELNDSPDGIVGGGDGV